MKNNFIIIAVACVLIGLFTIDIAVAQTTQTGANRMTRPSQGKWTLWHDAPARNWLDAMPLGNGHIGAMVYGGIHREQIALNEVTMWSGEEYKGIADQSARGLLTEMQQALLEGDFDRSEVLKMGFAQTKDATERVGTHLPVGDLWINFGGLTENNARYRRELDMERSVTRVEFTSGDVRCMRETFVSNPQKVLISRFTADQKKSLSFTVYARQWRPMIPPTAEAHGDELVISGRALEKLHSAGIYGVHFEIRIKVLNEGGSVRAMGDSLVVDQADAATLLVSITTDFGGFDYQRMGRKRIAEAAKIPYERLLRNHIADFQPRFNRVDLTLGNAKDTSFVRPTDQRIREYKGGKNDPALVAQFFQFGRYLTLAGSREDSRLPLPLQGLWSDAKAATMGWSDDYHLDINTQQNYWVAEVGNLSESHLPLMNYIDQLRLSGRQTAQHSFGARGWCAHVTSNAWGAPNPNHGLSPTCGAWQATHLWEHYAFTGNKRFLSQTAYPILKESAMFFLDFMIKDPKTGWLVTSPAYSPENHFQDPVTGAKRFYTMGNTGDTEVIYELFRVCIESSRILGIDADFRDQLKKAQAALPPLDKLIHKDGRLMEWLDPSFDSDYARRQRHTHHLLGLFPFEQITPDKTPAVAQAARATLHDKLTINGWEDTEWTRANFINFYARLRDGDAAYGQLAGLFRKWIPGGSLLTVSWENIFCLDGNTGGAAGIAEMLLQSHSGQIELLPALPASWPDGSVRGLCARGGFEVAMTWHQGKLKEATIRSTGGTACKIRYGNNMIKLTLKAGESRRLDSELRK